MDTFKVEAGQVQVEQSPKIFHANKQSSSANFYFKILLTN